MNKEDELCAGTKERILEAAIGCFAEKGYGATKVADICTLAGTNIASVNYHFRSKEALYRASWERVLDASSKAYPQDGGVEEDAPAEERLRGRIRGILQVALSDEPLAFNFMSHEMSNPTGLLKMVMEQSIDPMVKALEDIISEIIGEGASEELLREAASLVIGPPLYLMRRRKIQSVIGQSPWFAADDLERLLSHFTDFAVAGLKTMRPAGKK
ncbi:MAG: hypothetical protein C0609_05340 [Deltaproteobacteria bacterium]|nr:MAG: hypothetical protein C0609_05340 [Deltaproteobacteria bacterium]